MNIDIRGVDYMLFQGNVDAGLTGDVQNALCVNQKQTDPVFDKVVDEPLTSFAYEKTTGIVPSERPKSRFKSSVVLGSIDATTLLEENNGQSVEFDDNIPFDGLLAISAMEENEEYIQNVSNTQDLLDKEGNDFTFFKELPEDQKFRYDSNHSLSSTGYETLEMIDDDVNNSLDSLRQKLDEGSSENLHNAETSNMKFNFESKWNDVSNNRQIKTDNITDSTKSHHESEIESNSDFVNKKYVILLDASDDEDGDDDSIVNFLMANRDMLNTNKLEQEDETLQLIAYRQTFHFDDQSTCGELRKQNSSEINDLSPVSAKNSTSQNLPIDEFGSVNTTILDYNQNFNETYTVSISTSNKKTKQMVTFSTNDSESASRQDKKELLSCNRRPEALKMSKNQNTKSNSDFRNNCATIHSFNEETSLQSMNLFQPHSSCENNIQDIDNRIKMEVGRVSLNSNTSYSVKKNVTDSLKTAKNQRKSCDITSRRRRTSHQSFRRYTRSTTMPLMKAKNFPMLCMRNASVVRKRYSMQTSRKLSAFRKLRKLNQKVFADSIRMRAFEDSNYTKVSNKSESIERSCTIDLPVADTKDVFKTNVNNDSGILKSRNLLEKQMNKNPTSEQQFANSIAGCPEMKLETVIDWTESTDDSTSDCTTAPTIKIEVESDDEAEDANVDMLHFMLLKEMWSNKNANEQLDISETYLEQNELFITLLKEFLNKKNCSMYIPQLTGIDKFLKERNINIVTAGTHNNIVSQKKAYPSKSDADTFSTKTAFTKSFESLDANIKSNSNHSRSLRKQTTVSDVPYLEDEKFLYRHDMSSMRKNLSPVPTPTFNDDLKIEKPNCECSMQDEVHVKTEFCNVNYCEQYDTARNVTLSMHKIYDANETSTVKSEMENFEDEMDIDETKEIIFPEGIGSMNLPFNCKCSENFIYGTHIGTACDAVQKYSCNCNESQGFDCKDLDNSSGVTKSQYSSYTYSVRKSQRLECPRNQISQPVVKLEIMDPENCRAQPTVILKERRKKSGHQDSCRTLADKKRRVKRALQHSAKRKLEPQECISARTRSRCTRSSKNPQTQIQHSSDPLARQKRKRPKNSTAIESRFTKHKARRTRRVSTPTRTITANEQGKKDTDMEIIERTSECSVNQSPRKNSFSTKRKLRPQPQHQMKDKAHEPIIHETKSKNSMESKTLPNLQSRISASTRIISSNEQGEKDSDMEIKERISECSVNQSPRKNICSTKRKLRPQRQNPMKHIAHEPIIHRTKSKNSVESKILPNRQLRVSASTRIISSNEQGEKDSAMEIIERNSECSVNQSPRKNSFSTKRKLRPQRQNPMKEKAHEPIIHRTKSKNSMESKTLPNLQLRVSASTQIISSNDHGKNNSDMEIIERTSECSANQSPRKNIRSTKRKLRPRRQNPIKDKAHEPIIHRTKSKNSTESKTLPNLQLRISASTQIISGNEQGEKDSDMEIIECTSECSINQSPQKDICSTKRKLRPRRKNPMKDKAHEPVIHRTKSKYSMESKILPNLQLRIADQISDICKANKDNIARNNRTKDMSKSLVKTKGEKNIPRILKRNAKPSNSKKQMETDQQSIDGENTVHLTYQVLRSTLQKTHPIGNDKAVSTEKDSTVLSTNGYTSDTSNSIQGEKEISEEPVETTETVENIRAPTINLCNDLYTRYFTNFITASGYKVKFCYVNRRLAVLNAVIANADEADSFVKAFSQFDCANYNVWRDTKQGRYILHRTWLCGINGSQDPDVNYKNLSCQARIHISVDNPTTHDFNAHVLIYKEHTHYSANKEQLLRIIPL